MSKRQSQFVGSLLLGFLFSIPSLQRQVHGAEGGGHSKVLQAKTPQVQITREFQKRPRLVVMIVIDQFRADYLTRFESQFLPPKTKSGVGGFRYLMSEGAYFPFGQYDTMQSITAPGHATVLSGTYPYQSGIPLNIWFDSQQKKPVYCVHDASAPTVWKGAANAEGPEDKSGVSPKYFNATTLGDELKNAGYPSKVISVALKDRAAVLMGGQRADLALWFDSKRNQWVSSEYYLPEKTLPAWIVKMNSETVPKVGTPLVWDVQGEGSGFSDTNAMALEDAGNAGKLGGKSFPHKTKFGANESYAFPVGVEMTELAAERALDHYKLGQGKATDVLAVSFSGHDVVGHAFGPNSREAEEITLIEDRLISQLLNHIRKQTPGGLNDVVIAFTADHGVAPSPEWAVAHKLKAGRIDEEQLTEDLSNHLNEKFGKPAEGKWVPFINNYNVYLNHPEILKKKVDLAQMEASVKSEIEKDPRVVYVFTSTDYKNRKLPPGIFERQIHHTYYPGRSGDVVFQAKPYIVPPGPTANHVTGYAYDRTVPIILAGLHLKKGTYATRAEVVDIAPTLSFLTGALPPSLSEGRVLAEILQSQK